MATHRGSQLTIMRTAAGCAPSVSQIRRFQEKGLRVVAVDSDPLSVGFVFADAAYQVPLAHDPDYLDALLAICDAERVGWLIPNLDEELVLLAENREQFERIGTQLLLSETGVVRTCTDKLRTSWFFHACGIPGPRTWDGLALPASQELGSFPKIIKPREGRGSTGVHLAHNTHELHFYLQRTPHPVVQDFAPGVEYTVDALADFNGNMVVVSPRRRLATDSGISSKGANRWHKQIVRGVGHIVRELPIIGPANIQCFATDDGEVLFTEVNARIAGSCILTEAAGVPFFEGIVAMLRGERPRRYLQPAPELVMLRYWNEVYIDAAQARSLALRPYAAGNRV